MCSVVKAYAVILVCRLLYSMIGTQYISLKYLYKMESLSEIWGKEVRILDNLNCEMQTNWKGVQKLQKNNSLLFQRFQKKTGGTNGNKTLDTDSS